MAKRMMVVLLLFAGCTVNPVRPPGAMPLCADSAEMRQEVLRHICIGMPLDEAKSVLRANGFACKNEKDGKEPVVRCWIAHPAAPATPEHRLIVPTIVVCVILHSDDSQRLSQIDVNASCGNAL